MVSKLFALNSLIDDFFLLDEEAAEKSEEESPKKELIREANFFDNPHAEKIYRILSTLPRREFRSGMNPYECAVLSEIKKNKFSTTKTGYFIDADLLSARGTGESSILSLSGSVMNCSSQTIRDLTRWGKNSYVGMDGQLISLELSEEENRLQVSVNERDLLPVRSLQLIENIQKIAGGMFPVIMRFFNQGPLNDMVYDLMAEADRRWGAVLIPNNKKMQRAFHLISEQEKGRTVLKRILITVRGVFDAGSVPFQGDLQTIERSDGVCLGMFYGATAINLENRTAFVRTHLEVYPKNWNNS